MITTYYIIRRSTGKTQTFNDARAAAVFMLGKQIHNFIVVKSNAGGDRIITLTNPEFTAIEATLAWALTGESEDD